MTDTLPRAIPTDPAEQWELMPEWVKDEWVRSMNAINPFGLHWRGDDLACGGPFWPHALTIWQWIPEPVDPDEIEARSRVMHVWQHGTPDRESIISLVKLAIKRGRELEREAKP